MCNNGFASRKNAKKAFFNFIFDIKIFAYFTLRQARTLKLENQGSEDP